MVAVFRLTSLLFVRPLPWGKSLNVIIHVWISREPGVKVWAESVEVVANNGSCLTNTSQPTGSWNHTNVDPMRAYRHCVVVSVCRPP
jgi:hypothetical protein